MKSRRSKSTKRKLIISIVILLIVILIVGANKGKGGGVYEHILTPVKTLLYKTSTRSKTPKEKLEEENERLRKEILTLQGEQLNKENLQRENIRLRRLLGMKAVLPGDLMIGKVKYMESFSYREKLFIDKGEKDGIKEGMLVYSSKSFIGSVSKVYDDTAEVTLFTKDNKNVSILIRHEEEGEDGKVEKTETLGILRGTGRKNYIVEDIPLDANVSKGDKVYTSGISNLYPKGSYVGEVVSVEGNNNNLFQNIEVGNNIEPLDIQEVIIKDKE